MHLLLLLLACDGPEEKACTPREWFPDADGDGFGDASGVVSACDPPEGAWPRRAGDCDDADPGIFPHATETCDAVDEDCDGTVDEDAPDAPTWYADDDGDGFGDAGDATRGCEAPLGAVADASDCDDRDALTNPAGVEVCGGGDEDCDGVTDEDDATDVATWYLDGDRDGWGDESGSLVDCAQPSGFVALAGDCDDTRPEVRPDALEVCGGADEDCDGAVDEDDAADAATWYPDGDHDGFGDEDRPTRACERPADRTDDGSDCDDGDREVNPDAREACGGGDEDCDGTVDEAGARGSETWFADADGDGWGDPAGGVRTCWQPPGTVDNDGDCDDADAAYHPDATEACGDPDYDCDGWDPDDDRDGDGTADCADCDPDRTDVHPGATEDCDTPHDDDCDGSISAEDGDNCVDWYVDADADGYGDAATARCLCAADGAWTSALGEDCDDGDRWVSPGNDEDCATTGDDDCDGTANEADAAGCTTWYGDGDGDGYGEGDGACLCAQDDPATVDVGEDCDGGDAAVNPGEAEACADGIDQDCDGNGGACGIEGDYVPDDAEVTFTATYGQRFGEAVAVADLDGDGVDDVFIGAPLSYEADLDAGAVHVWWGPVLADQADTDADATLWGDRDDQAGYTLDTADTDGDGVPELLVGAVGRNAEAGAVWVWQGPPSGDADLSSAAALLEGVAASDNAGLALAGVGDTDGDGLDDVLVGAYRESTAGYWSGAAYLVLGPVSGTASLSAADTTVLGTRAGDYLGYSVAAAGDLDGDGLADVVVGAFGDRTGGVLAGAALVFGGPVTSGTLAAIDADGLVVGSAGTQTGYQVAGAGDADGDGLDDLLVTVCQDGTVAFRAGAVALFTGPIAGAVPPTDAAAVVYGDEEDQWLGKALSAADFDGDGALDLVAAGFWGTVGVVYGPLAGSTLLSDADARIEDGGTTGNFGRALATGDPDDDGDPDLLAGVSSGQEAWIFPGGPGL